MKFQRAADASGVAHLLHDLAIERQWLVVELVRCLNAVGRKKAVEVPLPGNRLVKLCRLLAFGLGQLQAACLPVAPAIGIGQVFGEALGKPVCVIPLAQAQQQPGAPFADGVVTQFGVVFGHHFQGACVETLGQRQPDLPGDGDFLFGREGEAPSVAVEQIQRLLRVLTGEAAQSERHDVGHFRAGWHEAIRLAKHLRLLRDIDHQLPLRLQGRQAFDQIAGHAVVTALDCQLGALPAAFFGQQPFDIPQFEQGITGVVLRLADQPKALGRGIGTWQVVA